MFIEMKKIKSVLILVLSFNTLFSFAQQGPTVPKIKITGRVVEKISKQPLEYATITFLAPNNPKPIAGGITNPKGEFEIDIKPGVYDIKIEFISFKVNEIKQKNLKSNTSLGLISLEEDANQLNEVVIRSEKTTV